MDQLLEWKADIHAVDQVSQCVIVLGDIVFSIIWIYFVIFDIISIFEMYVVSKYNNEYNLVSLA